MYRKARNQHVIERASEDPLSQVIGKKGGVCVFVARDRPKFVASERLTEVDRLEPEDQSGSMPKTHV